MELEPFKKISETEPNCCELGLLLKSKTGNILIMLPVFLFL